MATSVAEVELRIVSERTCPADRSARDAPRNERRFALLLSGGLTLFAVAINGYHPGAEDGGLYMAGVDRLLGPALFPYATAFVLEPMRHSLFASTVAAVVRLSHLSLPIVLLAFHLLSIWATLFAAWMLASRCWTSRPARAGAVVLLACWLALPVAGTALLFMDPYATARSLSTPAMVLALAGALDMTERGASQTRQRGLLFCAAGLALAAAMHPLMAVYALGATLMLLCARSPNRTLRPYATAALAAAALAIATFLQAVAKQESAEYVRVALTRTYWFPAQWRWYELVGLAAPLAILTIFSCRKQCQHALGAPSIPRSLRNGWELTSQIMGRIGDEVNEARQALARMAIAVGATSSLIALLFARAAAATHLIARLQPLRAFQVVYLVMLLMLGAELGERVLRSSVWRWVAAMLLLGGVMLATERSTFPNSDHLELPGIAPQNQWERAFLWVRHNTPKNALFALDADYINAPGEDAQCFRAIAERSALPDYSKDGGEASIAPELTAEWTVGQAAQQHLSAPPTTDAQRLAALRPLGVSWVVLQSGATTSFDCPYSNAAVRVCRLR